MGIIMKKLKILERIYNSGIVAVVRAENDDVAKKISKSCIDGGINAIEITFTVPKAHKIINALRREFSQDELIIGAGTILDSETARIAILEGAEFIVSPGFQMDSARCCNRYQVPYMPGCMSVTEVMKAMEYGVDVVKIFPANVMGIDFIKAVKGPIPDVEIMPTGGVTLDNAGMWIKNGCFAIGVGSELTAPAKTNDFNKITNIAKIFIEKVKNARRT